MTSTRITAALAATALLALAACSSEAPDPSKAEETDQVEVMSWWTSTSEKAALAVLFDAYKAANPKVTLTDASVAGGSGSNATVVLANRLIQGDPPDVWQGFLGGYLKSSAARGQIADVTSAFAPTGLADALPPVIKDGLTVDGKQYGVPTGAHRSNVLFYSVKALAQAGITAPKEGYTLDAFIADLAKAKGAGIVPLCLGAKDRFTSAELYENVLLATVGAKGFAAIADDSFNWTGDQAKASLKSFGAILDHADPAAGGVTWDAATARLASGECAFESMNDSAYGELISTGAAEGSDFGYVAFPGTSDSYIAVVDTFVASAAGKNLRNAVSFLTGLGDKETQLAFNKIKGSVPIRTDVDVASLSPYQQASAEAYRSGTVLLSIAHGEAVNPAFHGGFYDAVESYARGRDAGAFADTLEDAVVAGRRSQNK